MIRLAVNLLIIGGYCLAIWMICTIAVDSMTGKTNRPTAQIVGKDQPEGGSK